MNHSSKGFSLTEMLISLALSLFIMTLLIKIYHWHTVVQHKIDDMVFLDHQGVLAMLILENNVQHSDQIKIQPNKIILSQKTFFIHQTDISNGLFYFEKNQKNSVEVISGVTQLNCVWLTKHLLKIKIELIAPYGLKSTFSQIIEK
jgi:prepilin-type N-terminal cleavage/methylation domain-containing protein